MEPPTKKVRKPAFRKDQPLPSAAERKRLATMSQNTPAWNVERGGRLGASGASERCGHGNARIVDRWGLDRGDIIRDVDDKLQKIFDHGHNMEPKGSDCYVAITGRDVELCGLFIHPTIPWLHASPDRLVGTDGLLEVKCPYYGWVPRAVPEGHLDQIQQQLEITGRDWCDYIAYVDDDNYGIWRVPRSKDYWSDMFEYLDTYATCLQDSVCPTMLEMRPKFSDVKITKTHCSYSSNTTHSGSIFRTSPLLSYTAVSRWSHMTQWLAEYFSGWAAISSLQS